MQMKSAPALLTKGAQKAPANGLTWIKSASAQLESHDEGNEEEIEEV